MGIGQNLSTTGSSPSTTNASSTSEGSFVDQFIVKPIVVGPGRCPDELEGRLPVALSGVEKLVWLKITGPTVINLVSSSLAIATTLQN